MASIERHSKLAARQQQQLGSTTRKALAAYMLAATVWFCASSGPLIRQSSGSTCTERGQAAGSNAIRGSVMQADGAAAPPSPASPSTMRGCDVPAQCDAMPACAPTAGIRTMSRAKHAWEQISASTAALHAPLTSALVLCAERNGDVSKEGAVAVRRPPCLQSCRCACGCGCTYCHAGHPTIQNGRRSPPPPCAVPSGASLALRDDAAYAPAPTPPCTPRASGWRPCMAHGTSFMALSLQVHQGVGGGPRGCDGAGWMGAGAGPACAAQQQVHAEAVGAGRAGQGQHLHVQRSQCMAQNGAYSSPSPRRSHGDHLLGRCRGRAGGQWPVACAWMHSSWCRHSASRRAARLSSSCTGGCAPAGQVGTQACPGSARGRRVGRSRGRRRLACRKWGRRGPASCPSR